MHQNSATFNRRMSNAESLSQSLVNKATHIVGMIIPSLDMTIFPTMPRGIQEIAALEACRVMI